MIEDDTKVLSGGGVLIIWLLIQIEGIFVEVAGVLIITVFYWYLEKESWKQANH